MVSELIYDYALYCNYCFVSDIVLLIVFCSATHRIRYFIWHTNSDRMISSERSVEFLWLYDRKSIFCYEYRRNDLLRCVRVMNRRLWVVFHVSRATPCCPILMGAAFDIFGHYIVMSLRFLSHFWVVSVRVFALSKSLNERYISWFTPWKYLIEPVKDETYQCFIRSHCVRRSKQSWLWL